MIEFDEYEQKMVLKLVYYGPALSGKTTNLLKLHEKLTKEGRGDLMVLDTKNDRTIYFDLLPFFSCNSQRSPDRDQGFHGAWSGQT